MGVVEAIEQALWREDAGPSALAFDVYCILAAIDAAGWAVVPKEPTEEMSLAGSRALCERMECTCDEIPIYRAMLAASPKPE